MVLQLLFVLSFFTIPGYGDSQSYVRTQTKPFFESIEGSSPVWIISKKDKKQATVGMEIDYEDRVKTGTFNSASIIYPDRSKIIIAANSEFKIEQPLNETQWNRLYTGSVRGMINKNASQKSDKPKFLVRSKAAVLGVRGTDFIMSMNAVSGEAQVHTLEGTVEVGNSEISVMSGKGTLVNEGNFLEGTRTGLSTTQSFDKTQFLKTFQSGLSPGSTPPSEPVTGNLSANITSSTRIPANAAVPDSNQPASSPTAAQPSSSQQQSQTISSGNKPQTPSESQKQEDQSRKINFFSFQASLIYFQFPDTSAIRALSFAWTPSFPVPLLPFFSIRGYVGGDSFQEGIINSSFLVLDFQAYLVFSPLRFLYIEGGMGEQIWRSPSLYNVGLASVNAGIQLKLGPIDRIFVGYQALLTQSVVNEYKVGIGISIF